MQPTRSTVRFPSAIAVAATLALSACADQPTVTRTDTAPAVVPLFDAATPANGAGRCLGDDAVSYRALVDGMGSDPVTDPFTMNCTANDVSIATSEISHYFDPNTEQFVAYDAANPPHCTDGGTITLKLKATLKENATSERQDIGVWINTDGKFADKFNTAGYSGSCNHYNLPPSAPGSTNGDNDQCSGLASQASVVIDLGTLTLPCTPNPVTGKLRLGSCVSWKIPGAGGDDGVCSDDKDGNGTPGQPTDFRAATLPSNKSKCNCNPFDVNVIVDKRATIEVKKVCSPANDAGTFDLNIGGVTRKDNATCGGGAASTTGAVTVDAGTNLDPGATHSVSETDFTTANYVSTYACTKNGDPYIGSTAGTGAFDVSVQPNDAVVCTFTNTRKGSIVIVKNAEGGNATFPFTASGGAPLEDFGLITVAGTATKTFSNVIPGAYTVAEGTLPTGWSFKSLNCSAGGAVSGQQASITLAAGATVTCTYTNSAPGTIQIVKNTAGGDATFAFTGTGGAPVENFELTSVANTATRTFADVPVGSYVVTEATPPTGWAFTSLNCTAGGAVSSRQATITMTAGATVTCTYVNTALAKLDVSKVVTEGGTESFNFTRATMPSGVSGTFSLSNGQSSSTGFTLLPATYTVCELAVPAAWATTATVNGTPQTPTNPDFPQDFGNKCVTATLAAGATGSVVWTNSPPPVLRGEARTIGYWKNWSSCSGSSGGQWLRAQPGRTLDGNLPILLGVVAVHELNLTTCPPTVALLDKRDFSGAKRASDPLHNMAAQLVAVKLNIRSGADPRCVPGSVSQSDVLLARYLFDGTSRKYSPSAADIALANSLAGTLDRYNNNTLQCP